VTIGSGVTSIGVLAFYGCTSLTKIHFNATACDEVPYYVFTYAGNNGDGINVKIGANVTKIPANLFSDYASNYSPKIISVEFEECSVCELIEDFAFRNCSSLTSVNIKNRQLNKSAAEYNVI
jgi:hypothetical protein